MSDAFPVFDSSGRMLGNLTSDQGTPPTLNAIRDTLQPLPNVPAIGGSASGASGNPVAAIASTGAVSGGATPPTGSTGSVAGVPVNNWFVRAVVVILGFVFVAVGLSQFGVVQRLRP